MLWDGTTRVKGNGIVTDVVAVKACSCLVLSIFSNYVFSGLVHGIIAFISVGTCFVLIED